MTLLSDVANDLNSRWLIDYVKAWWVAFAARDVSLKIFGNDQFTTELAEMALYRAFERDLFAGEALWRLARLSVGEEVAG